MRRDRKSDAAGWIDLPTEGRAGDPPDWPLSKATARELSVWEREWCRPQAIMWERNGQETEVALYVRSLVAAEARNASVAARTLVRQQMESLGVSIPGLQRNRWRISGDSGQKVRTRPEVSESVRDRMRLVQGGGS